MKTISNALKVHLAQPVTTLTVCWRIIRQDGMVFAYTGFDADLIIEGVTYSSVFGFNRSAITTGSTGSVDNLQVVGFLSDGGITAQDIHNGLFDYAVIHIFLVNWADLTMGTLKLRRGWLGECTIAPNDVFMAELRGLTQALVQEFGNVWQPLCRADLGDSKCKVPIKPAMWLPNTDYLQADFVQAATQTTDPLRIAIFQAASGGTSGNIEPAWNTAFTAATGDNGITWISQPWFRGISSVVTPIDAHNFISASMPVAAIANNNPGNQGVVSFRDNVSAGTSITVSDGIHSVSWNTAFDIRGSGDRNNLDAIHGLYNAILAGGTDFTLSIVGGTLYLTDTNGLLGSISKSGDILNAIAIQNFTAPAMDGGVLTWISGLNAGRSVEVKTYDPTSLQATLWLGMNYVIAAGDRFYYYPGCSKRRDTCLLEFNNILNFRGEPDVRGMDVMLSYPELSSA